MVFIQERIYLKDGAYVRNLDEYESIGTHCINYINYTNLFSPNDYEKNDKIILKCFH